MYKIVETIERGSKQLTVVPQAWEKQGVLFWPKMKTEKLIKIGTSIPEDSWFQMGCKLKRNELETYETAEQELCAMLKKDDSTESEEQEVVQRKKRVRVILPKKNPEYDYNEMARKAACMNSEQLTTTSTVQQNISDNILVSDSYPQNIIYLDGEEINDNYSIEQSYNSTATVVTNEILPTNTSTLDNNKLSTIIENQGIIINNQNAIMEYLQNLGTNEKQLKILQQLSKFEAMQDVIAEKISNLNSISNNCSCKKSFPVVEDVYIDRIETVEHFDAFECKLKDKDVMKENIERLSFVCGKRGDGHGINNSYILIDRMFSRKFMTLCSWAGGARGEKEKVAFKMYKNVISLFFNVVHLSDKSFTHKDCEIFLKNVIRNSTRRSKSDLLRTSTIKRRSKKPMAPNAEEAVLDEDNEMADKNNSETLSDI